MRLVSFDLISHLHRQRAFSERTFGPGPRVAGVTDHLEKELREVRARPDDLSEWIDLVLLALDGAWRQGFTPEEIALALAEKQTRNESRTWPDWRTADPTKAIEHDRADEPFRFTCALCGKDCVSVKTEAELRAERPPADQATTLVCGDCFRTAMVVAAMVTH